MCCLIFFLLNFYKLYNYKILALNTILIQKNEQIQHVTKNFSEESNSKRKNWKILKNINKQLKELVQLYSFCN